jgi:hypothetical protein
MFMRIIQCLIILAAATQFGLADSMSKLQREFLAPPASARPWVYWFWLNGNITSNGITADLEAMQRVGIGGVLIMEVDQGTPRGKVDFASGSWRQLFQHVCAEANRLGLEVNMNNDAGWCGSGGPWITPELSMQKLVWTETNLVGPLKFDGPLERPTGPTNYYRDVAVLAFPTPDGKARVPQIQGKAAFVPQHIPVTAQYPSLPLAQVVAMGNVSTPGEFVRGNLEWEVPPGNWTLLRLGHTTTGKDNHPAPESGRGLESDKLSPVATEAMFNGLMAKLIKDSPNLAGRVLVSTHIDSWETGSQNWTPLFREEFKERRGYDPLPWLPAITGRVVQSLECSERFLWDLRQTVSDLLVENYAGHFRRLAAQNGLRLSIEAYDNTPCDDLAFAAQADEPMSEFWSWGYNTAYSCVEMSSAAHVYGRRILGAEAFTANDQERWLLAPDALKILGDWAFCEGINRFVFHRYALQPWLNRQPGMSMGPWGLHYERTQTWWELSQGWHEYLARCQHLLRQGVFVADILYLQPEGSPRRFTPTLPDYTGNTPDRPRHNFDGCTAEALFTRVQVKNGRLVLPDGLNYRVLVLPQVETMTPRLLRRVGELVAQGASVIGPPPTHSPSLANFPKCDIEVRKLAENLWNGSNPGGKRVLWSPEFVQPPKRTETPTVAAAARWIWHREGNPAASAPPGKRFFRADLVLPPDKTVSNAVFNLTADNAFVLWVNGRYAIYGSNFKQVYSTNITRLLQTGTNILAVGAENTLDHPNPAGLIGTLRVDFTDASHLEFNTGEQWRSAPEVSHSWTTETSWAGKWEPVMELGAPGVEPWGEFEGTAVPPYVFPKYEAIARWLEVGGCPPDFEADRALRFIHRQVGECEIYFVANSQTNPVAGPCAFRVTGKVPELWDPLKGTISRPVTFEERGGRTVLPLWLEPAGSVFVVFRPAPHLLSKAAGHKIVGIKRNGTDLLPKRAAAVGAPGITLSAATNRNDIQVQVSEPGRYELTSLAGKSRSFEILPGLPALQLDGPWNVQFQPGGGAPPAAVFTNLMDWSVHPIAEIRHFSGMATYQIRFTLPPGWLRPDLTYQLDLGQVAVMAAVEVNGQDLGTLWKSPFQVDITSGLKEGVNVLQIDVANLWVNRMIADEALAEDSDRNDNGTLKSWPEWLESERPSPSGRISFTSWRLWAKDAPLQPSGLLGPVRLRGVKELFVPYP